MLATGYRLSTTDQPEDQGGIGNVGWALDVDVGNPSQDGRHDSGQEASKGAEDGEIVNSEPGHKYPMQSSRSEFSNGPTTAINSQSQSVVSTTPRVLRLVLVKSDILPTDPTAPKVAILDSRPSGYYLARDRSAGKPVVRLKEMEVSKVHAMVWHGSRDAEDGGGESDARVRPAEKGFWIVDCGGFRFGIASTNKADGYFAGSTHGTFILAPSSTESTKPLRLSEPRQSSLPYKLEHLTRLTIGTTTFECHLHADWPCDTCALHDAAPIPIDDPSTAPTSTSTSRTGTPGVGNALDSPVSMPNASQWNATETRRVALTSEAKRMDQARRAGVAMRSLKAQYFGNESGKGKGGGGGKGKNG